VIAVVRDGQSYTHVGEVFKLAPGDLLILLGGHKALDDAGRILSPSLEIDESGG
jgi:hypothetical protein